MSCLRYHRLPTFYHPVGHGILLGPVLIQILFGLKGRSSMVTPTSAHYSISLRTTTIITWCSRLQHRNRCQTSRRLLPICLTWLKVIPMACQPRPSGAISARSQMRYVSFTRKGLVCIKFVCCLTASLISRDSSSRHQG